MGRACSAGKASAVAGLGPGSLIHSRRPERLQRPNPSTLPDFSLDGILFPTYASVDDHYR